MTSAWRAPVDLDNCATEPIHVPGAVQPHGVLLALAEPDLVVAQCSANAARLLGLGAAGLLVLALLGISWEPLGQVGTSALLVPSLWFASLPAAYAWVWAIGHLVRLGGMSPARLQFWLSALSARRPPIRPRSGSITPITTRSAWC